MANVVGTPVAIAWGTAANPASQDITPPAGATGVAVFFGGYSSTDGVNVSAFTLDGNAADDQFVVPGNAGGPDEPFAGCCTWYNVPTGSPLALDPQWTAAMADGPVCLVVYLQDIDTAGWRDAQGDVGEGATAVSATVNTSTTDLVLKWDSRFGSTAPALSAGWTSVATQADINGYSARVSSITPAGATQIANGENESYSGLIAVSFPDAPAGGGVTTTTLTSTVAVADELLRFVLAERQLDDTITTADGAIASAIRGVVGTDEISVTDQHLLFLLRYRLLEDLLTLADESQSHMRRFITLTSLLAIADGSIASYFAAQTVTPLIVIGFDQPDIRIGQEMIDIRVGGYAI